LSKSNPPLLFSQFCQFCDTPLIIDNQQSTTNLKSIPHRSDTAMESSSPALNMMDVDEETKQIVRSFLRVAQHTLLSNNALLRIIPELVHYMVIQYYYRTHSIYEWKVDDPAQLTNIKSAVPGFSFNHHFKLHKLDWFLKFYPNGTKQSKQGNVFLLLYLRSTPEISRMSATCRVWLSELDKGREHYKDFNEKNKYTGWRSGLVKTSEIEPLTQMTFQVTVTIFEIYDQEGRNVTNKYIGLGIDAKQTITYLRKELLTEKEKVQRLTIELDERTCQSAQSAHSTHHTHALPISLPLSQFALQQQQQPQHYHSCFSSPSQVSQTSMGMRSPSQMSMGHFHANHQTMPALPMHAMGNLSGNLSGNVSGMGRYRPHDIDDEKSLTFTSPNSPALPPLPALPKEKVSVVEMDPCRVRFEKWLCETVKLGQYLHLFRNSECDDVRMIEFFEEAALEKEIGVARTFHRKLILKKATEFKAAQSELCRVLEGEEVEAKALRKVRDALEDQGIVSLGDLADLFGGGGDRVGDLLGDGVDAKMVQAMERFVRAQV